MKQTHFAYRIFTQKRFRVWYGKTNFDVREIYAKFISRTASYARFISRIASHAKFYANHFAYIRQLFCVHTRNLREPFRVHTPNAKYAK